MFEAPSPGPPVRRLVQDALAGAARNAPEKTVLRTDEGRLSYAELLDGATRFASALQQMGFRRGDRGAVYLENSAASAIAIYGILEAGGVFVVVHPQTKSDKLRFILRDCGARILVTGGPLRGVVDEVASGVASLTQVVLSGPDLPEGTDTPGGSPELHSLDSVLAADPTAWRPPGTIPTDLAALLYTSGSTGEPKGVMQTHLSMTFAARSVIEALRLQEDDVILNALPLSFDYGLYQLLMAVELSATLVLERSFAYPATVLSRVAEEEVTVFPGVPTIFSLLIRAHRRSALSFPSVRRVTNTADALPPSYLGPLREIFPHALVFPMYGQTECKRVSILEPELVDRKPGSVGKPIPGTEALLLGADGREVAPGEAGILHVRGPHVMAGYWNDPEGTARALPPGPVPGERMLRTGDWFRADEEGFLYFIARSDEIIKSRGEKVSPAEVERAVLSVSGIEEAAVVGVPDEVLGRAIRAFVVVAPEADLDERRLRRELSRRLESFMMPRDLVFVPSLPRTPNGKLARRELV